MQTVQLSEAVGCSYPDCPNETKSAYTWEGDGGPHIAYCPEHADELKQTALELEEEAQDRARYGLDLRSR